MNKLKHNNILLNIFSIYGNQLIWNKTEKEGLVGNKVWCLVRREIIQSLYDLCHFFPPHVHVWKWLSPNTGGLFLVEATEPVENLSIVTPASRQPHTSEAGNRYSFVHFNLICVTQGAPESLCLSRTYLCFLFPSATVLETPCGRVTPLDVRFQHYKFLQAAEWSPVPSFSQWGIIHSPVYSYSCVGTST